MAATLVSGNQLKDYVSYTITMGDQTQTLTMDGLSYIYGTARDENMGGRGQMNGLHQIG